MRKAPDKRSAQDRADEQTDFLVRGFRSANLRKVRNISQAVEVLLVALGGVDEIRSHFRRKFELVDAMSDADATSILDQKKMRNVEVPIGLVPDKQSGSPEYADMTVYDVVRYEVSLAISKLLADCVFPYGGRDRKARSAESPEPADRILPE